eukprot:gb/GECH01008113.1/.p1 GENE.gb/GECH01008113.1/~~gb/GECH01008113.1/.p1  ORF type:complete len:262 (+),score=70.95 gb/GECH01008113.1/:1-786(+)
MSENQKRKASSDRTLKMKKQRTSEESELTELQKKFQEHSQVLDAHHDRKERIFKTSRDITTESKRTIFLLHRINHKNKDQILEEASEKIKNINENIAKIAKEVNIDKEYYWRYFRSFSGGLQEYVEAVSLLYYLQYKELVPLNHFREKLLLFNDRKDSEADQPLYLHLSEVDYILGIGDLTGELMRLATNAVVRGDLNTPAEILSFMEDLYGRFQSLPSGIHRDIAKKTSIMKQSLEKVEKLCYRLQIRGEEERLVVEDDD